MWLTIRESSREEPGEARKVCEWDCIALGSWDRDFVLYTKKGKLWRNGEYSGNMFRFTFLSLTKYSVNIHLEK